jgi:hypothetical protein
MSKSARVKPTVYSFVNVTLSCPIKASLHIDIYIEWIICFNIKKYNINCVGVQMRMTNIHKLCFYSAKKVEKVGFICLREEG